MQLSIFIFSAFQLRTRSHATRQTTRRFQSKPFLVSLARSSRRFREATARAFKSGVHSSLTNGETSEINSRTDFLRRRSRGRVQSVNIDALVRKTGPVGWILFLETRFWKRVKRVVSTDRGQIWEGKAYEN